MPKTTKSGFLCVKDFHSFRRCDDGAAWKIQLGAVFIPTGIALRGSKAKDTDDRQKFKRVPNFVRSAAPSCTGLRLAAPGDGTIRRHQFDCPERSAIITRALNIRLIYTIGIASYDHQDQAAARVLKEAHAGDGNGWPIVDHLVDTGATARFVRERPPKAHFATIYSQSTGRPLVDTFVTEASQDTWILFPWDAALAYAPPIGGRN
jgi:hypothetical protein